MPEIRDPEFREQLEATKYPFADAATLLNAEGRYVPETTFLDAVLHPIGWTEKLYLSKVTVGHDTATVYIGDVINTELASCTFDLFTLPDNLVLTDSYGRPAGLLVSEALRLAALQALGLGTHEFTSEQTEFACTCCVPTPGVGFRGFVLADGSLFSGDIWLVGEDGVALSADHVVVVDPADPAKTELQRVIRVDVVGDPLFRRRLCGDVFVTPRILQTVTFKQGCREIVCGPDERGDIKLTVGSYDAPDTILRIRSVPDGLLIESVGEQLQDVG